MPFLLAAASALLLILSYPPWDLGGLAWVALVPWLALVARLPGRQSFLYSYGIGLAFFAGTVGWLLHVALLAALLIPLLLALYFALWGFLAHRLLHSPLPPPPSTLLLGIPALWVLMEFARSHFPLSGFGFNLLAHTQWHGFAVIQMADVTGVYGISFLVAMVNVTLWRLVRSWKLEAGSGMVIFCLLAAFGYGHFRLRQVDTFLLPPASSHGPRPTAPSWRVAILQGNIPQVQKWEEAFQEEIWRTYESLTVQAAHERPALIVWPETAVPALLEEVETDLVRGRLCRLAWAVETPLLVGVAVYAEQDVQPRLFNSAVLLDAQGQILQRYDKIQLVPFGEYIPLRRLFGWLERYFPIGDFSAGVEFTVFDGALPASSFQLPAFSVLICFEDLFPYLARRFLQEGAQFLLVLTNDAWFKRSAESIQHLQASVFRAVEGRVWVARAANTGWSGFVDPAGRRLPFPRQIPRFEPGVAVADLRPIPLKSPYARFGGWFEWLCLGMAGLSFLRLRTPI